MRKIVFGVAIMATLVSGLATLAWGGMTPEVRPFVGAFIPTGNQRDVLADAVVMGAQGGVEVNERMHLIGTLAWAPHNNPNKVSLYNYDMGLETFQPFTMGPRWELRPFVGAGVGGRTYVDHANGKHNETNFGGYGALGTEFQLNRIAMRVEGRDYITRFKGLRGDLKAETRNDVAAIAALAIHW